MYVCLFRRLNGRCVCWLQSQMPGSSPKLAANWLLLWESASRLSAVNWGTHNLDFLGFCEDYWATACEACYLVRTVWVWAVIITVGGAQGAGRRRVGCSVGAAVLDISGSLPSCWDAGHLCHMAGLYIIQFLVFLREMVTNGCFLWRKITSKNDLYFYQHFGPI